MIHFNPLDCHGDPVGNYCFRVGAGENGTGVSSGALPDLGWLIIAVLLRADPAAFERLSREEHAGLEQAELAQAGFSHTELSAAIVGSWKLPAAIETSPDCQPGLGFHARERRRRKPASDFPCSLEVPSDSICAREQLHGMLYQAMHALPARHQQVVQLYYTDQKNTRETGGLLGDKPRFPDPQDRFDPDGGGAGRQGDHFKPGVLTYAARGMKRSADSLMQ
jgi:hypothetical protein